MEERGPGCNVHIRFRNRLSSGVVDKSKSQPLADRKNIVLRLLLLARWEQVLPAGCLARTTPVVVDEGCGRTMGIDCTCCHLDWRTEVTTSSILWSLFAPEIHALGGQSLLEGCSLEPQNLMKK